MTLSHLEESYFSRYKWLVLLLTTVSQTSISYVGQGVAALAPVLQNSFHLSAAQVGLVVSANNLGIGLTALVFGGLVDKLGDKKIMVFGGLMTGITILIGTMATNYWVLLLLLVITGMWAGAATPAGSKAILNYFLPAMRGMAMGIRQMGVAAGGFIAALTLPLVAKDSNWETALGFAGVIAILSNLVYLVFYKSKGSHHDGGNRPMTKGSLRSILSNRAVWYTSFAGTTLIGSQFVLLSYTQLFLHTRTGMSFRYTFYFLALSQLMGMAGRVVLGVMSDRLFSSKRKPILLLVSASIVVLSLLMLLIGPGTPWWLLGVLFALIGFVSMGWNGLWVTLASELVDSAQSSSALGAAMSLLQLGVLVFPSLFGVLVDRFHSYNGSWVFIACSVAVGFLLLTRVPERKERDA